MDNKRSRHDGSNNGPYVQLPGGQHNNRPFNNHGRGGQSTIQADIFPFASLVTVQSEIDFIRSRVNRILGGHQDSSIPSPLPGTLSRKDLPKFLRDKERYRICEKSDGERALMYVCKQGIYLVNRKFQLQKINDDQFNLYTNIVKDGDELLLDGEVIQNYFNPQVDKFVSKEELEKSPHPLKLLDDVKKSENVDAYLQQHITEQRYVYCMFDVAYFDNEDVQDLPLDGRLGYLGKVKQRVREYLLPLLKEKLTTEEYPQLTKDEDYWQYYLWNLATLRIETKDFQLAKDMRRILRSVVRFSKDHGYLYLNYQKQLKSKNDGFIFTPIDNNYMMSTNTDVYIYKYKWPGLNTVDFHINAPFFDEKNNLILLAHGYDGSGLGMKKTDFEFARVQLTPENREYVLANTERADKAVVECNYDAKAGRWLIKHLRTDKHKGNFFSTVLSCLEAMIDNLRPEELEAMLR